MAKDVMEQAADDANKALHDGLSRLIGGLADAAKGVADTSLPADVSVGQDGELHITSIEEGAPD